MNLLDLIAAAYAAMAAGQGARKGVALEGYKLVRLGVSVLAGCGLFTLINKAVAVLLGSVLDNTSGLGFALGIGLAFYAMRKLKAGVIAYLHEKFAEKYNRLGGAIAGFLRALTAITALIAFMQMSPWIPGGKNSAKHSLIGRVVSVFTPQRTAPPAQ
jgi:hypothetical protein